MAVGYIVALFMGKVDLSALEGIAALSLSIGLGFTQVPEMLNIFPDIIRTIFAENCVAVVFLAAIIMNLIMPKDSET